MPCRGATPAAISALALSSGMFSGSEVTTAARAAVPALIFCGEMHVGWDGDEITGATIVWDNTAEVFKVEGGAATAANPTGRVRLTLTPRAEAASGAASGTLVPLAPCRSLGAPR